MGIGENEASVCVVWIYGVFWSGWAQGSSGVVGYAKGFAGLGMEKRSSALHYSITSVCALWSVCV